MVKKVRTWKTKAGCTDITKKATKENVPNGFFRKRIFSFALCFSWFITIFCLLFGDAQNAIHSLLALCSFLTGVALTFTLVFKKNINTAFFKFFNSSDKHDNEPDKNN